MTPGPAAGLCVDFADTCPADGSECWATSTKAGVHAPALWLCAAHTDRVVSTGTHLPARPSSASLCRRSAHLPVPPGHSAPHLHSFMAVINAQCMLVRGTPLLSVLLCSPTWKQTRPSHPQNMLLEPSLWRSLLLLTVQLLITGHVL